MIQPYGLSRKSLRQLIYNIIYHPTVNRILLLLNKLLKNFTTFRLPPSGTIVLTVDDISFKLATNQTSYVSKLLYWNSPLQFEYTEIFKDLIKDCHTFFDIGANAGYYSILGAKINTRLKVYAFEPSPGPLHYLKQNVRLNQIEGRLEIHATAMSDKAGEATFYEVKNPKYKSVKYNLSGIGSLKGDELKNPIQVKTDTFDNFVSSNATHQIDLIKLDTEGTENFILRGAKKTIKEHLPIIICETLFNTIEWDLEVTMKELGYLFYNHRNGKLSQVNTLVRSTDDGIRDCFFIHPSKLNMIKNFTT